MRCAEWGEALAAWALPDSVVARSRPTHFHLDPHQFSLDKAEEGDLRVERIRAMGDATPTQRLEHLIDIGSAAGSSIGALIDVFERITCVEANPDMASALRKSVEARGLSEKITVVEGIFPDVASKLDPAQVINASNVAYNVSEIGPFLDAMDTLARSLLLIELTGYHPLWSANGAFRHFYGIERPRNPTAIDLFSIVALEHPEATLESYPLSYRRRPFSLSALRTRLGFDDTRDGELEAYLVNAPLPHNPSMLITARPRCAAS